MKDGFEGSLTMDREINFMEHLHNTAFEDEVIMNIIYEEAESFFQGPKTAETAAWTRCRLFYVWQKNRHGSSFDFFSFYDATMLQVIGKI